jgi:carboxymethylenebutenolidase
MGEMVEFRSDGVTAGGYLARAAEGAGLGVLVIQEWRGIADHIVDVCDRFAGEGFTALAPDLRHGRTVPEGEPDEAAGEAMALDLGRAAGDLSGAVDFLQAHPAVRGHGVAVVGFSMGGGLALWLATLRPDEVRAAVPFYGLSPAGPDWSAMTASVEGHFAEHDRRFGPDAVHALEERLHDLGKEVRVFTYAGARHGFFDDTRPEVYDDECARTAWVRTLEFLRAKLG